MNEPALAPIKSMEGRHLKHLVEDAAFRMVTNSPNRVLDVLSQVKERLNAEIELEEAGGMPKNENIIDLKAYLAVQMKIVECLASIMAGVK